MIGMYLVLEGKVGAAVRDDELLTGKNVAARHVVDFFCFGGRANEFDNTIDLVFLDLGLGTIDEPQGVISFEFGSINIPVFIDFPDVSPILDPVSFLACHVFSMIRTDQSSRRDQCLGKATNPCIA